MWVLCASVGCCVCDLCVCVLKCAGAYFFMCLCLCVASVFEGFGVGEQCVALEGSRVQRAGGGGWVRVGADGSEHGTRRRELQ